jgi:hypothetical protein
MKRNIGILGVVGLIGCFLPLVPGASLFDFRHFANDWTTWLIMAAFALPAFVGLTAKSNAGASLAGLIGFGYLALKFRTATFDLVFHASSGGIVMGIAIILGVCASVAALATPSRS